MSEIKFYINPYNMSLEAFYHPSIYRYKLYYKNIGNLIRYISDGYQDNLH